MRDGKIAVATTVIDATRQRVWHALTTPEEIAEYMFGAEVESAWLPGSAITWRGEFEGKPFEDKGVIREVIPNELLRFTHYSPLSGLPDSAEHYHNVTIALSGDGDGTVVTLTQDNNATDQARQESQRNWERMLGGLKALIEGAPHEAA